MKKILIWGNNWIGDVVSSLPAVNFVKKTNPDAKITMVVKPPCDALLLKHPSVSKVLPYNKGDNLLKTIKLIFTLRKAHFDEAYIFPNSFRSALMVFFTGAKLKVGYESESRNIFLNRSIKKPLNKELPLYDFFYGIVKSKNSGDLVLDAKLTLEKDDLNFAEKILTNFKSENSVEMLITIHPGTSKPPRSWNIEKFIRLCKKISSKYNAGFIIVGNKEEYELGNKISNALNKFSLNACGTYSFAKNLALIKNTDLFIGNDSGIMHIAASFNIPTVAIFGPDIPERVGPFNKSVFFPVTKRFKCSPCRQNFFKDCEPSKNNKALCIEEISVTDVLDIIEKNKLLNL